MTQQDYNNNESLRPEISEVSVEGVKRRRTITISRRASENSLKIMKMANKGHIYETASKFAERSDQWARKSDFLSPIVESAHTPVTFDKDYLNANAQMDKEIELSKTPPNAAELGLYLDGLNNLPNENSVETESAATESYPDNVVLISEARARLESIVNAEAA
jgi:hypothetical protein